MFKLAQRAQLSSKLTIQGLSVRNQIVSMPSRGLKAKQLIGPDIKKRDEKRSVQDVYGELDGCLGIVKLNREHRYNMMTPSFINEINRGIASMDVNQNVSTIYMAPHKGQMFSNGTCFRTLAHMQKEGSDNAIAEYMQQIYWLQVQVAALTKPLISVAPGHCFNSGATLLAASGIPLVQQGSKIAINEVTYGFVPHAGATYYLSRLPGEFGTFMALTGMQLDGSDAIQLGLASGAVQDPLKLQEEVAEIIRAQEFRPDYGQEYHENILAGEDKQKMYFDGQTMKMHYEINQVSKLKILDEKRRENGNLEMGEYEDFIQANDRVPSAVADAEYRYMKMLRRDQHLNGDKDIQPYLNFDAANPDRDNGFLFHETFKGQHDYLMTFLDHWYHKDVHVAIRHKTIIDRCFYPRSVEEIMQNLKKEPHPFAKECLAAMQRNSLHSLQLTREMMHKASNLDYTGCMQNEVNVGLNRIRDTDFALGVDQVLRKPTPFINGKKAPRVNPGFKKKPLSESQIQKYFEPSELSKKVNVGAVRHALLPTRHHYERFTDHIRIWINEESSADERIRDNFDLQAKQALKMHGIDIRDKALTIQSAREHLAAVLAKERVEEVRKQRFNQVMLDEQLRDEYYAKVDKKLTELVSDKSKFYGRVNTHLKDIFEYALLDRMQTIQDKSKEAQKLDKRRILVRLKKFFFKEKCLNYTNQMIDTEVERCKNYPYRLLHGLEDNNTSWHDIEHHQIDKSPLSHIGKAIGRVAYSPVEMTREFLTNPARREQLSMLTLDKKELLKLQHDVIKNPDKYIAMFTRKEAPVTDYTQFHWEARGRKEMVQHVRTEWWRMYNDYMAPQDYFPHQQQFAQYKEWTINVELKAIDTLRNCLSQLLIGLEDDMKIELEITKGTTKRQKLEELMALLDEAGETLPSRPAEKKVLNASTKDNLDSLQEVVQKMLSDDRHFNILYQLDKDGQLTKNKYIVDLRTEAEQELLKLVEIVLLDKYGKFTTDDQRKQLNERLETLFQHKGKAQNHKTLQQQLGIIDQYLHQETRHEALRDALDLVKPYFVNIFQRRLEEVTEEILQAMQWKTTNHLIQIHYFGEQAFPGFTKSFDKEKAMLNRNHEYEDRKLFEQSLPFITPQYRARDLMMNWGEESLRMDENGEYSKLTIKQKKARENATARKRNEEYDEVAADIFFEKVMNKGYKDPDQIMVEMFNESLLPETTELLESLDPENIQALKEYGFTKQQLIRLKEIIKEKKEIEARPQARKKPVDYHEAYNSLQIRQQYEIDSLRSQEEQIMEFLDSIRYEIEHNLSKFDWLKMYSKVLEHQPDFNQIIEDYNYNMQLIRAEERQSPEDRLDWKVPEFDYVKPVKMLKSKEEWKELKDYADFVFEFYATGLKTKEDSVEVDLEPFMQSRQPGTASIFEQALAGRNEYTRKYNEKNFVDRNLLIKSQIEDFNALQQQKETNRRLHIEIRASASGRSKNVRDFVEEVLKDGKYVDLRLLKQKLATGKPLTGLVNTEKLIKDLNKSDAAIPGFFEKFALKSIDVLSLDEIQSMIEADNSLTEQAKTYAKDIVQHVNDQTIYVSNNQRKAMTMEQFLGNHHHTNSEPFTKYASNVLAQKIKEAVGSLYNAEADAPSNIEWELGRSRTSPYDLKPENQDSKEKIDSYIQKIVADGEEDPDKTISYYDHEVNAWRVDPAREHELKKVMLDAADITTLPQDLQQVLIYEENQFLLALASPTNFEEKAKQIISDYTEKRLKYCMLQPGFQDKIQSKYGFVYMKMLRERVSDELKLTKDSDPSDLAFENLNWERTKSVWLDVESKYNLTHLNNTDALGFDNLIERAAAGSPTGNADAAQGSVLDKLMADYFLGKKTEYKEANNMIYGLADMFEDKTRNATTSVEIVRQAHLRTGAYKEHGKDFNFESFKDLMDLDLIVSKSMQNGKNGLSNELRELHINETTHKDHWLTQVPDYFDIMDVRKPAEKVVDDRLFILIKQAFDVRLELEKTMNRRELLAFDKVLARHLQLNNLAPRLKESLREEFNLVNQGRQIIEERSINKYNEDVQLKKRDDPQREMNLKIIDSDAQFKSLSFQTMLELEGKAIQDAPGKVTSDKIELANFDSIFSRFYLKELEKDVYRNPRPINDDDFRQKKPYELTPQGKFPNMAAREEQLFEDHKLFQENKLEQQQRIQLFYVLEQFFEEARQKPDQNSEAQTQIKDYFANPENTFFFDKNKIS